MLTARLVGLAALAAGLLTACGRDVPLEERTVTPGNASAVASEVRTSTLPRADKAAFAAFLFDTAKRPQSYDGKTVRGVINAERAHEVGTRLERQDRESDKLRRATMSHVIVLRTPGIRDVEGGIVLQIDAANKTARAIDGFDAGLEVDDKATRHRLGLAELHISHDLAPHAHAVFTYPMRYVRFGEDTASMRLAQGRAKTARLDPLTVRFKGTEDKDRD